MDAEQEQRYIVDRVGEETNLEECALCYSASCFSCVSDHCIALEKLSDGGCAFYKDYEENHKEIWRCFYRLIRCQRFDLLTKYADTLAALGLMDHEIAMAEKEHGQLEEHRLTHLRELTDQNWRTAWWSIIQRRKRKEPDDEENSADLEPVPMDLESVFDNGMDVAELPAGMTDKAIDDETAVDIQTRDYILCEEVKEDNFRVYELIHEANERLVLETGEDDLPEDYGEYDDDEDLKTDENGNLLNFDEYIEREEEKEREKEAEEEKEAERMQSDRTGLMMVRKHMYLFP